ncbi:hypothetical protein JHK85_047474 [Glycine max]|nr:hypothetical protein JHK85_047474 [Glycine max]
MDVMKLLKPEGKCSVASYLRQKDFAFLCNTTGVSLLVMMSDYAVETINDGLNEFNVEFHGPKESLYEGGVWKIRVELPDAYPYKSPSIGFVNKIFHPNVDELSGSVCLDVINQSWSPMFDLLNVFEVFLPQLLLYPNASDPLNGDAASLMMKDKKLYDQKVKVYEYDPTPLPPLSPPVSLLPWLLPGIIGCHHHPLHCCRCLCLPLLITITTIVGLLLSPLPPPPPPAPPPPATVLAATTSSSPIDIVVIITIVSATNFSTIPLLPHPTTDVITSSVVDQIHKYCERYAKKENISNSTAEESGDEEDISEEESGSSDDEIPGRADP